MNQPLKKIQRTRSTTLCCALLAVAAIGTAHADNYTWFGGGDPDMTWANGFNWAEGTPPPNPLPFSGYSTADGTIAFSGVPLNVASVVNTPWSIGRLVFDSSAGNFVLSGSDLILEQGQSGNANYSIHSQGSGAMTIGNTLIFTTNAGPANPRRQIVVANGGTITFNGNIVKSNVGPGEIWFRGDGVAIVNGTILWDTNRLVKTDNSVLQLNSSGNQWSFATFSVGTIRLGVDNALPTDSYVDFNQNAVAVLDLNDRNQTLTHVLVSVGGTQSIATGTNAGGTLTLNDTGNTYTFSRPITGTGSVVKGGTGTFILSGASTFTGGLTVNGGVVQLNNGAALASDVTVNSGAALVFNRSDNSTFGGSIVGAGEVRKTGTGTVSLSGPLAYGGATTISNGTLLVNGTLGSSSGVSVYGGALGGTGNIGSPVDVFSGQIQPGTALQTGTLAVNDLTIHDGGALSVKLAGASDVLNAGTLNLNPGSALSIVALGAIAPGSYTIATYTTLNGTFTSVLNPTHYNITVDYATPGQIKLNVSGSAGTVVWGGQINNSWDLSTLNWTNGGVPSAFFQGDHAVFDDGAVTFSPGLTTILYPGSVTVDSGSNYTFSGTGRLSGTTSLTKNGSGTLTLSTANDFTGTVTVNAGTLRLGNASALGLTNGVTIVNDGGTLDVNSTRPGLEELRVVGNGVGGTNGAINNTGGSNLQDGNGLATIVLMGDTLFRANRRWDMAIGGAGLIGNGHKLSKTGAADLWIHDVGDIGVGDIEVLQGTLGFQGAPIEMGNPAATITVMPGATFGMWDVRSNLLNKQVVLTDSSIFSGGSSNNFIGPITLQGTNTISTSTALQLGGNISGPGGFIKTGGQTLYLNGVNSYSGPTLLNAGQIVLGPSAHLNSSSFVQIGNNLTLDATLPGGITRGNGQTLAGSGTLVGNAILNSGSTLSPGLSVGTLAINGALTLSSATNVMELGSDPFTWGVSSDFISVQGELTLNGVNTLHVVPVAPLSTSYPYTLILYNGILLGSGSLQVVSANPRYNFSVDLASTPGQVLLNVTGNPTPLVWKGGKAPSPTAWDHTTTNWFNGGTGEFDRFYDGDLVTFDDTAVTNRVTLTETNMPGLIQFNNNALNYTLTGTGTLGGTLAMDGTGRVTLAVSNNLALGGITNNQGTLVFDMPLNTTLPAVISDTSFGAGTIVKANTNTLTLTGDNSLYYGTFVVSNGVLRYNNAAALGVAYNSLYVTNANASLDINNIDMGAKTIVIAGQGVDGQGTIMNSQSAWPAWPYQIGHNVTFAGDAAIGSLGRWDFANGMILGNGYKFTKVGGGEIWLVSIGDTGWGDIEVASGMLGFQQETTMGDPVKTITVQSNATFGIWDNPNMLAKNVVLNNGTLSSGGGASNNVVGNITLNGMNTFQCGVALHLWGNISGPGGFNKFGGGTLWLDGNNTYSGPTRVGSNSRIHLGAGTSLGNSSSIQIDGGSTIDATVPGSLTLGAGQVLKGSGALAGNLSLGNGATVAAGDTEGQVQTLTIDGNLTFGAGSTNVADFSKAVGVTADLLSGIDAVVFDGTLVVNNSGGAALEAGDSLKLFDAASYSGSFDAIVPAAPGVGLEWDASTLTTDGTLRVIGGALPPAIEHVFRSGNNLVFTGFGGTEGGSFSVLSHTNVAAPLDEWTVVGGGTFGPGGAFSITNAIDANHPRQFYILQMP